MPPGYRSGVGRSAQGADAFLALSKRLKEAGEAEIRKELHKAVRNAGKPLIPKVRAAALRELPSAGGLNQRIAKKPYRSQARTGAKTAGLRITGGKVDPRINNQGRIAHPVFGRPKSTVVQTFPEARGYFDETLRGEAPQIREEITEVLVDFAQRLMRPL
jgi:hypothetical protein